MGDDTTVLTTRNDRNDKRKTKPKQNTMMMILALLAAFTGSAAAMQSRNMQRLQQFGVAGLQKREDRRVVEHLRQQGGFQHGSLPAPQVRSAPPASTGPTTYGGYTRDQVLAYGSSGNLAVLRMIALIEGIQYQGRSAGMLASTIVYRK